MQKWVTAFTLNLNLKRAIFSKYESDGDKYPFSVAEELSLAINGSTVPSITYFWLVGD